MIVPHSCTNGERMRMQAHLALPNKTTHTSMDEPFLLDLSNYDPGYDVEVALPYAIEEPDDEPDQVSASVSSLVA